MIHSFYCICRIIRHPLDPFSRDVIKVMALAGSGKTSTLTWLCEENPHLRFLVVVFNRSVKEEATRRFPANARCMTTHGLAFKSFGRHYFQKLTSNLSARHIISSKVLRTATSSEESTGNYMRRVSLALSTLENFLHSPDDEITTDCVPAVVVKARSREETPVTADESTWAVRDAVSVWDAMVDKRDKRIRMPHDGYLKLWQLSRPILTNSDPHDVILLDEAQDLNPAALTVFMKQPTPLVLVGDPHQQIYSFRGATNALESVRATHTYYLTQSFRFGPEIAYVANCCLGTLKGEKRLFVAGGKKVDALVNEAQTKPVALIARTNQCLLDKVVTLVCDADEGSRPKCAFAGGFDSYEWTDYEDFYNLKYGRHSEVSRRWQYFHDWQGLQKYAQDLNDVSLLGKIDTVNRYGQRIPQILSLVRRHCNPPQHELGDVDYVFSTVHKAKGLEWESVQLLGDFRRPHSTATQSELT